MRRLDEDQWFRLSYVMPLIRWVHAIVEEFAIMEESRDWEG